MKSSLLPLFLVVAFCATSSPAWAQQKQPQPGKAKASPPGGPRTEVPQEVIDRLDAHPGLVYAKYGGRELALDLYRPKNADDKKLPGIVCIHGGGWWKGDRSNHTHLAQTLAARGFVTATISYRLSGEAPFPAQIHDCKAAVRFLRANAGKFGIDAEHIGAIGLSAGGHLTALLGTSGGIQKLEGGGGNADQSSRIQAAVPMGAQTNFNAHLENLQRAPAGGSDGKPNIWSQFLGGKPMEVPEQYQLASPITHLNAGDPPLHFITGELDQESTHAKVFRGKMNELGIAEGLTVIPDAPHAFPPRQKFFDQMIEVATEWFKTHLK